MRGIEIVTMALALVVAQYFLWRFLRRREREHDVIPEPVYTAPIGAVGEFSAFLKHYGTEQEATDLPVEITELHPVFIDFMRTYRLVRLDVDEAVYNRRFVSVYSLNADYIQFGEWPDGSAILARRHVNDPAVYIDDIEDSLPGDVRQLATSLSAYFRAATETHGMPFAIANGVGQ